MLFFMPLQKKQETGHLSIWKRFVKPSNEHMLNVCFKNNYGSEENFMLQC